jgi:hypothetical protein
MKKGSAKSLVMQRQYRSQVVRDKTKYRRKFKHKKAPDSGGFSLGNQNPELQYAHADAFIIDNLPHM